MKSSWVVVVIVGLADAFQTRRLHPSRKFSIHQNTSLVSPTLPMSRRCDSTRFYNTEPTSPTVSQTTSNIINNIDDDDGFTALLQSAIHILTTSDTKEGEVDYGSHSYGSASQGQWIYNPMAKEMQVDVLDRLVLKVCWVFLSEFVTGYLCFTLYIALIMMMCAALCLVLEWIEHGFFVCGTVADDSQNIQIGALLDVKGSNTKASVLGGSLLYEKGTNCCWHYNNLGTFEGRRCKSNSHSRKQQQRDRSRQCSKRDWRTPSSDSSLSTNPYPVMSKGRVQWEFRWEFLPRTMALWSCSKGMGSVLNRVAINVCLPAWPVGTRDLHLNTFFARLLASFSNHHMTRPTI